MTTYVVEKLAFDAPSVRDYDENGFLHVKVSHLTKEQVAPYRGMEIPGWQRLGLDASKVYKGYRPAEELSKPKTVNSVNGIPIQIEHHPDFASAPAKETRAGSTGTDGEWKAPYLNNSLHIQDKKAIDLINSGAMRELSLAYRYTPDFKPGKTPDGESYDFVMRDISANHVALVEEGRAGRDVLVMDESLKDIPMDDKKKVLDPNTEEREIALAQKVRALMQQMIDLHKPDAAEGHAEDEDTDGAMSRLIELLEASGMKGDDLEEAKKIIAKLSGADEAQDDDDEDLKADEDDEPEDEGEEDTIEEGEDEFDDEEGEELDEEDDFKEEAEDDDEDVEDVEEESEEEEEPAEVEESEELKQLVKDALRACGYDSESEEFQRAFAEGVKYGETRDKEAAKTQEDKESDESDDDKKPLGQDTAKSIKARLERDLQAKADAIDEVKGSLGHVKLGAFDSAGAVYLAALKQEGYPVKGLKKSEARSAYRAFMRGKSERDESIAQDAALEKSESVIGSIFDNIRKD